jgi:predicted transposase/invertase (TIGR01784 family)
METDSFFCQLLKQLPETLFELLGLPPESASAYRFDSVELKKSLRIDGLFLAEQPGLPLYFVEVQFQRSPKFYANLFAKVFCFLEENDPSQDWTAVALFESRSTEPMQLGPYEALLNSGRVVRIYLDELTAPADPPFGLGLLQLVSAPEAEVKGLVRRLVHKAEKGIADSDLRGNVIELLESLLLRRFAQLNREEIRAMFQLHDLKESKVWQEAHQTGVVEGREEGLVEGREMGKEEGREEGRGEERRAIVQRCLAKGMTIKEIASLMDLPLKEVRRLAKPPVE